MLEKIGDFFYYYQMEILMTILVGLAVFVIFFALGIYFNSELNYIGTGEVLYSSYSPPSTSSGVGVGFSSDGKTMVMPMTSTKSEEKIIIVKFNNEVLKTETDLTTLFSVKSGDKVRIYERSFRGINFGYISNIK